MEKQMVSSTAKLVQQVELVELHSPDHGSKNLRFMFLVVAALHRLGGEARRSAVQQELLADPTSKMTEGEATAVMADIESVSKLMTEARRHLVHYGLLVDHRSSWKLTPTAALVSSESELHHVAGGEAEEEMDTETWQNDVLEKLGSLTPDEFEQFVAFLMAENGVFDIEVTGRSSDGGIDGIGSLVKGIARARAVAGEAVPRLRRIECRSGLPRRDDGQGAHRVHGVHWRVHKGRGERGGFDEAGAADADRRHRPVRLAEEGPSRRQRHRPQGRGRRRRRVLVGSAPLGWKNRTMTTGATARGRSSGTRCARGCSGNGTACTCGVFAARGFPNASAALTTRAGQCPLSRPTHLPQPRRTDDGEDPTSQAVLDAAWADTTTTYEVHLALPAFDLPLADRPSRRISGPIQFVHKLLKTWKLDRRNAGALLGFGESEVGELLDILEGRRGFMSCHSTASSKYSTGPLPKQGPPQKANRRYRPRLDNVHKAPRLCRFDR